MPRRRRCRGAYVSVALVLIVGCGPFPENASSSAADESVTPSSSVPEAATPRVTELAEPETLRGEDELDVITAINSVEPAPKEVRYDADRGAFIVTLYTEGEVFTDERLNAVQAAAEEAVQGETVIIELTDEDPPVLND